MMISKLTEGQALDMGIVEAAVRQATEANKGESVEAQKVKAGDVIVHAGSNHTVECVKLHGAYAYITINKIAWRFKRKDGVTRVS